VRTQGGSGEPGGGRLPPVKGDVLLWGDKKHPGPTARDTPFFPPPRVRVQPGDSAEVNASKDQHKLSHLRPEGGAGVNFPGVLVGFAKQISLS